MPNPQTNPQKNKRLSPAEKVLADFGLSGAPVPVDRIAKSLGAQLRFSPLDQELSGMIYVKEGTPIIGVNSLHHPNRQRFTIAHEIGHLILHRNILMASVHVDKEFRIQRGPKASEGTDRIEIDANNFASELLLPAALLEPLLAGQAFDIDDEKPMEELAKKFRVSKAVLGFRIQNLHQA